jgi:hypothetical protein
MGYLLKAFSIVYGIFMPDCGRLAVSHWQYRRKGRKIEGQIGACYVKLYRGWFLETFKEELVEAGREGFKCSPTRDSASPGIPCGRTGRRSVYP